MSRNMDPVRTRGGNVDEKVRLRPPAQWGYPSLADPGVVPAGGVKFTVHLPDTGEMVQIEWLPQMSALARDGTVGEIVGHHGGSPAMLPVVVFPGKTEMERWQCIVHPNWLDFAGCEGLGPECECPTAQLMTLGCTCGRARREREARRRDLPPDTHKDYE